MKKNDKSRNIPALWNVVKWFLLFVVVFAFAGFLLVPPLVKFILAKNLTETLHREVLIEDIDINPFALSASAYKVLIKGRDSSSTLLSFDELYMNLQVSSVIKKGLILREVRIDEPYIHIVRNEDGSYNVSDLLEEETQERKEEITQPMRFSLNNIQILNGSVDFLDRAKETKNEVRDITIKIPMISNFSYFVDTFVHPFFQATVNDAYVLMEGKTKPFHESHETVIELDIKEFRIPHYLAYVPFPTNFKLHSGIINGKTRISYVRYRDRPSTITVNGDISLQNLRSVDKTDNPLLDLPLYTLKKVEIDISEKKVTIGDVYSKNGKIDVRRSKDGTVNLRPQLPKLAKKIEEAAEKKEVRPWMVLIKNLAYDDFTITFEDRMPSDPVNLIAEEIKLKARDISTEKNRRGSLSYSFKLNKKGKVSAESSVSINPRSADVKLSLKDINIIPLQPYITDKVKILITDGAFSTEGNLSYVTSEEGELKADYKGTVSLSKFSSVDKANANDFLKWNSLYLSGINFKLKPLTIEISEIALTDFYSRLIINPDGTLNVQGIVEDAKAETESPYLEKIQDKNKDQQKSVPERQIKINTVTLQGGTVNFSDSHIKPNFSANMLEIGGRISGLSSVEGSTADINLRGKLENYAPLEIKGKINPLGENLFVDLNVDFNEMDLSPLTPYSGRYVGYTIQKGKLSLDLQYLIVKKKLNSKNNVFLDQFTLGDRVEHPDATELPVKLAIALLKNRKGEINLDLPVSGNIDDPEFRLGSIIIKMLVNILVKAATSPFALLGAIVGGGEELSYIEFDYGSSTIGGQETAKLDKLLRALRERPSLNMDIEGYVDIEKDRSALRQYLFHEKLKARKLKEMVKSGQAAVSVNDITVEPDEYEKYLEEAYKEETFPKPRNAFGSPKKITVPEMEKLILTHIEINNDDLRQLASERAITVKDFLLKSGQIDPKRIFLTAPESLQPEKSQKLKNSRVDFKLK